AILAAVARQYLCLDQRPDALLEEKRIPLRPFDQQQLELLNPRIIPQQRVEQLLRGCERQRIDPKLGVVGFPTPAVLVLRTIVDEQQDPNARQTLDYAVEQRLRFGIDPVEIFKHHDDRLDLALSQEHP